jgi:hypothetical protein
MPGVHAYEGISGSVAGLVHGVGRGRAYNISELFAGVSSWI